MLPVWLRRGAYLEAVTDEAEAGVPWEVIIIFSVAALCSTQQNVTVSHHCFLSWL